jgi:hypothetical protein
MLFVSPAAISSSTLAGLTPGAQAGADLCPQLLAVSDNLYLVSLMVVVQEVLNKRCLCPPRRSDYSSPLGALGSTAETVASELSMTFVVADYRSSNPMLKLMRCSQFRV